MLLHLRARGTYLVLASTLAALACSCGSKGSDLIGENPGGQAGSAGEAGSVGEDAQADITEEGAAGTSGEDAQTDAAEEPQPTASDPALPGPCATTTIDGKTGSTSVHCVVPSDGPYPAPWPVVFIAHGFNLEPPRYYAYADRLGSFCFVACTVGYSDLANQSQDPAAVTAAFDWVLAEASLADKVDPDRAGTMGHSRGGKAAVLAAVQDTRFKAVLGLDPVNSCPPLSSNCPNALDAIGALAVPTTFLGETLDSQGIGQACAPAADNYQKFFQGAQSPSLEVTVNGANHMSFVADLDSCLACGLCKQATADHQAVLDLSLSYSVSFFQRWLRDLASYDDYLTGDAAQQRYVQTGLATLQSK
jgi:dienelactone hydrolase